MTWIEATLWHSSSRWTGLSWRVQDSYTHIFGAFMVRAGRLSSAGTSYHNTDTRPLQFGGLWEVSWLSPEQTPQVEVV